MLGPRREAANPMVKSSHETPLDHPGILRRTTNHVHQTVETMNQQSVEHFLRMLDRLCQRPGMFVGRASLRLVSAYIDGYQDALSNGLEGRVLGGFTTWIETKFGISSPAWHWTRIILHQFGSEAAPISHLPQLVREFFADREAFGDDGIQAQHAKKFQALALECHEPESTITTNEYP